MRFLFVLAAVFAVAFAQYGGPNEPDPVPTTDYPLEPEVSGDEPANEVPVQEEPVVVEPVKQVIVEEPAKVEAVEVLLPVPSSEAPVVKPSSVAPVVYVEPEVSVAPSSTATPVVVPVVRSLFSASSAAPRFAFTRAPVPQQPATRVYVPSTFAPVSTAFVKSVEVSSSDKAAKTNEEMYEINPNGEYQHGFSSDNGIAQQAEGKLRDFDNSQTLTVSGSFSWPGFMLRYKADETGYHPESEALPTPPPVPPQIQRAVEYLARVYAERQLKK